MSRIKSILKDSDSQCSRLVRSNFLPSGSMSLTSKISSKSTPAMVCPCHSPSLDFPDSSSSSGSQKLTRPGEERLRSRLVLKIFQISS